jgi:hypothetical protein
MIEYLFVFIFILLFIKPYPVNNYLKIIELVMVIYVSYKNPLLGILCAASLIKQLPVESLTVQKKHSPSRIHIDEQLRSKNSNTTVFTKPNGLPIQEPIKGNKEMPYKDDPGKTYTPF